MNYEERVLEIVKEKGVITTEYLKQIKIPKIVLTRLVKKDKLERVTRGVYISKNSFNDEYYSLTYGTRDAIYSYFTALYFQNLCERTPLYYDVTVKRNYGGRLQKDKKIKLHYVDSTLINLGKIKIKSPQGQDIYCYDAERCLCDIIKDKNKLYFEYIKYAFNQYYRKEKHDTFKLYQYAKKLGVEKQIHEFMETLM